MTDTDKLNDAILESGIKIVAIAGKLGISREEFYKKLNNETEFKASVIATMQKILGLTNSKHDKIFLLKRLNNNQPKERRMSMERVSVKNAADEIGCAPEYLRRQMKSGKWDLGNVVKPTSTGCQHEYFIFSAKLDRLKEKQKYEDF